MKCTDFNLRFIAVLLIGLMSPLWAFSQTITVSGTVVDELGEPLIGATVQQKGTSNGTSTDIDGKYTLTIAPKGTITVSYVGYNTQDIAVDGRTVINVTMKENAAVLDEVVVVGYGQMKRSDLTGSVESLGDQHP